jgi:uncharacterized protein YicC (UPF0701 family)
MNINEGQLRAQWRVDLGRIAEQIDELKARIDTESQTLHASLSAEVVALQSDLERLEAEVDAAGADAHAKQIAVQIEELSAKGDAAYKLLQAGMVGQLDPIDTEITRLEAIAATTSGDAKAKIKGRIETLRSIRAQAQASAHVDNWTGQPSDATH